MNIRHIWHRHKDSYSLKMSDNNSIHVIYKRPQNPSKYAITLEAAMTAQGIV